ncbi:MAG TPA: hypothetical protein VFD77_08365, partial [Brumimicrobium sp.]|nr:hypothetical protein [Brumimicrobium sp.]
NYFTFLSLGDAIASADKKKIKRSSKESILILLCFQIQTIKFAYCFWQTMLFAGASQGRSTK